MSCLTVKTFDYFNKGCLNVSTSCINAQLNINCVPIDDNTNVSVIDVAHSLSIKINCADELYNVYCQLINNKLLITTIDTIDRFAIILDQLEKPINVSCSIVCSTYASQSTLNVQPNVIFLTRENGWTNDVNIISNVEWIIK